MDDNTGVQQLDNSAKNVSSEEHPVASKESNDTELEDLLDSALEDFEKPPQDAVPNDPPSQKPPPKPLAAGGPSGEAAPPQSWDELFNAEVDESLPQEMQDLMKNWMSAQPEMMEQLEHLAKAAGTSPATEEGEKEFTDTLQKTLSGLAQNAENLQQQDDMSDEELMKMMSGMGFGQSEGAGGDMDFFPMMQGMMQSLLSKEVLYPSLKEMSDKYPAWLAEHKDTIDKAEHEKYSRQCALMTQICGQFEMETESDSEDDKRQRFEVIMNLMQQMQELGHPPKDIGGEMPAGMELDENGLPKMPGNMNPEQCIVM